jgi:hypothetical protein
MIDVLKHCGTSLQLRIGTDVRIVCCISAGIKGAGVNPRIALVLYIASGQADRCLLQALV